MLGNNASPTIIPRCCCDVNYGWKLPPSRTHHTVMILEVQVLKHGFVQGALAGNDGHDVIARQAFESVFHVS